ASAFRPGLYHFTSILWHALAAIALLLFGEEFLARLGFSRTTARWVALGAAFVWAIHPVQSAAVAYVSGRADPLAATFGFVGLFLLIRASRGSRAAKLLLLVTSAVALLLSALSKESGLIFCVLGLAIFAWEKKWRDLLKVAVAVAFVGTIYFALRAGAEHDPVTKFSSPAPLLVRPIIIARAVGEYAGLLLFPLNLHMDRDVETQPTGFSETSLSHAAWRELQTLLGIILFAAFVFWMLRARKRNPG